MQTVWLMTQAPNSLGCDNSNRHVMTLKNKHMCCTVGLPAFSGLTMKGLRPELGLMLSAKGSNLAGTMPYLAAVRHKICKGFM